MSEISKQSIRNVKLGENTRIADFVNLYECEVGDNSRIGAFVEVQKNARIGRNVKVSSHTFICEGVTIEDDVFVGHNVSFINDKYPRATANGQPQTEADWKCVPTLVRKGASIGTSSTILCGVTIGEHAIVGAGSVVTKDVPAHAVVAGIPARFVRSIENETVVKNDEPKPVPFLDLKAQYQAIKLEILPAVNRVLENCSFVLGEEVSAFERDFSAYQNAAFGIAVNTGTSALHLALLSAGIGPGDEVITVSFTFVATVAAIVYTGAKPVFVDIDPNSLTMDVSEIEKAITLRTKAILPVHIHGQSADMDPIIDIANRHGLIVIEDACQAHGAEYKGRRVGSIGDMGCFSFYPGKNLGAYGEGGMVVTNNQKYDQTVRMLRDWGAESKYRHILKGYNYRMEGMQGAVLRVKLRHLEEWTEARRSHAKRYYDLLADSGVKVPCEMSSNRHVYHIYAIRVPERDAFQKALTAQGVQSGIHYPIPVHLQPAYADLGYKAGDFPHTEAAAEEVLSLPMFAELTDEQQDTVSEAVHEVFKTLSTRTSECLLFPVNEEQPYTVDLEGVV
ncbi:MAG: aminotransferase class V-fold PLP-dependent enzyme [Desulfuromonadaceae bacterium]|nr:aminotransferase class V-fold PLP-dependent enzyme [Desulfuromonadaceae bacterium]